MMLAQINHIELRDGKAYIVDKRLRVMDIVAMHILNGQPVAWITENYDLSLAEIYAALAYYYDHPEEIEQAFQSAEQIAKQYTTSLDDKIAELKSS